MSDHLILNLDLNCYPSGDESPTSPLAIQSTVYEIEDRIRVLNGLYGSISRRQRRRRVLKDPPLCNHFWNITRLAKAFEVENANKMINNNSNNDKYVDDDNGGNNGDRFDCNICLKVARDPVLTGCGHLFCWSCFHQAAYIDHVSKECPVCEGEVVESNVIPIYGNGNESRIGKMLQDLNLDNHVKTPPRPRAHRFESDRQQGFQTRFDIGNYVRNEPQPGYQDRVNSVVNLTTVPTNDAMEID